MLSGEDTEGYGGSRRLGPGSKGLRRLVGLRPWGSKALEGALALGVSLCLARSLSLSLLPMFLSKAERKNELEREIT